MRCTRKAGYWRNWLFVLLLFSVSGCASRGSIYLTPGKDLSYPLDSLGQATVQLQSFAENFSADEVIGELNKGPDRQPIKIQKQLVSQTLRGLTKKELAQMNVSFGGGQEWDRTLEGLSQLSPDIQVIAAGNITFLWITGETKWTQHIPTYRAELRMECVFGLPKEKKIITGDVHVSQEMVKLSTKTKTEVIEALLDAVLSEAARNMSIKLQNVIQNKKI